MAIESSQKGVTLLLAVIIISVVLAMALGLTSILVGQLKNISGFGNSVIAYYAAESRTEQLLVGIIGGEQPSSEYGPEQYDNGSIASAKVVCCSQSDSKCDFKQGGLQCSAVLQSDDECKATRYCLRTYGSFQDVKRAIETKIFPQSQP